MPLQLRSLAGGFGAEIDVDLTSSAARGSSVELTQALHRHRLLVFPGQHLNHADLLAAAALFGTVDTDVDRTYAVPGFPGITTISNIVEDGAHVGIYDGDDEEEWHADGSFKPNLPRATLLYSVITPEAGGQTRFADATRAYTDLPAELQEEIKGLRAVHSIRHLGDLQNQASGGQSSTATGSLAAMPDVEHPLVRTHPVTAARSLLLGSMVISGIVDMDAEASARLVAELLEHTTSPPYLHTHHWRQGDLVIWDNQATLHTASPCDSSRHHRLLYRATIR
ncbi:TauD/TfdA family dioxygenase [Streptomyces sp. Edi2]|uniref:TauD/TfdA dioxygenase family protein n=1 Tax=Streptomyces sp. Edi2 TaxID=3162528 RepID=UPI003305AFDE